MARALGPLLAAAVLARQQAAGERAPDEDPDALVEAGGDELVLRVAGLQRVVDLLAGVAHEAAPLGHADRLRELPAREVRAARVADLAGALKIVERLERLLHGRHAVPLVHLVEVDVIGPEAAQARLAGADQVVSREPRV